MAESYEFEIEDLIRASGAYLKRHNLDTVSKGDVTKCVIPTKTGYKLDHWKLYCLLKKKKGFGIFVLPKTFVTEIDSLVVAATNIRKEELWEKLPVLLSESDSSSSSSKESLNSDSSSSSKETFDWDSTSNNS